MLQSREEYIKQTKWKNGKRNFRRSGGYGTRHMYKYYKACGGTLNRKQYHDVLVGIHKDFIERMLNGDLISLPWQMGAILIERIDTIPKIVDGKIKTKKKIDWGKTLDLWYNDPEAKDNKVLVKNENRYIYTANYIKSQAIYRNKTFVKFIPMRSFKEAIKNRVMTDGYLNVYCYGN